MAQDKKMDVPNIGSLLGKISEKRESGQLPKTERQHVQPVPAAETAAESSEALPPAASKASDKTVKRKAGKTAKSSGAPSRPAIGRPSFKAEDVEYVKISPRIPKALKQAAESALTYEKIRDEEGNIVKTIDVIVEVALKRLLKP